VFIKLQSSAAAHNGQPMASRSTHDQLMRKPITIEHHAQVKYIQNEEQSLVFIIKFKNYLSRGYNSSSGVAMATEAKCLF